MQRFTQKSPEASIRHWLQRQEQSSAPDRLFMDGTDAMRRWASTQIRLVGQQKRIGLRLLHGSRN